MTRVMYDSVDVDQIPRDATAVAGYINGRWPTFRQLRRFKANRLSIAVTADVDAACLDVETGDATPEQAPAWVRRQLARGQYKPVIYASRDNVPAVLAELNHAGINRSQIRLWTAHYGAGAHICGGVSCGARFTADATQWTDKALGRNLDESLLADTFFPPAPKRKIPKPPPVHKKVLGSTAGSSIVAAILVALKAIGVSHLTTAEESYLTSIGAAVGGWLAPAGYTPKVKT